MVISAIDNLVKGASGQAIQNMNLMAGFDREDGSVVPGNGALRYSRGVIMKVRDVMNVKAVTFQAEEPLSEAARLLRENKISGMPVLDGEKLVGIISESDLLSSCPRTRKRKASLWLPSPLEIIEVPLGIS